MLRVLRRLTFLPACAALALLVACDPADAPALRIKIDADLSGEVIGSSLAVTTERKDDLGGRGLDWEEAATIVVRKGRFASLAGDGVDISGIRLSRGAEDVPGLRRLLVTIPLGADAAWTRDFVATEGAERLRRALDAEGASRDLGKKIVIEISLPRDCKDSSLVRERRGFSAAESGRKATLEIDLDRARTGAGKVVWLVSWVAKD